MSDAPRQSLEKEDIMTVTWHGSERALDGSLFARRMADRLRREEWMDAREAVAAPSRVVHQATAIQ
jgi:hypothetical protein